MCHGELQGRSGNSVTDYFVLSYKLFARVGDACELYVSDRIESDHMPLELHVTFPSDSQNYNPKTCCNSTTIETFVWNETFFGFVWSYYLFRRNATEHTNCDELA